MGSGYVYDQAWKRERTRLQGIETMFDAISREHLLAVGIAPGWRCLEVGGGAGSVARWMASAVAPSGSVVATDIDPRHITDGAPRGGALEVRKHDIVSDPLEHGMYDLVHARMVLEHIPQRDRALARMIAALRPGGWLVVEDIDFGGPMVEALGRYVADRALAEIYKRILAGFEKFMSAAGADLQFGPRLATAFAAHGLQDIYAESRSRLIRSHEADFSRLSIEQLREPLIGAGLVTAAELDTLLAAASDPEWTAMSIFLVSARGQRPLAG